MAPASHVNEGKRERDQMTHLDLCEQHGTSIDMPGPETVCIYIDVCHHCWAIVLVMWHGHVIVIVSMCRGGLGSKIGRWWLAVMVTQHG